MDVMDAVMDGDGRDGRVMDVMDAVMDGDGRGSH